MQSTNLITKEKWQQYYKNILTQNRIWFSGYMKKIEIYRNIGRGDINIQEIKCALQGKKNGKAVGSENIFVEHDIDPTKTERRI